MNHQDSLRRCGTDGEQANAPKLALAWFAGLGVRVERIMTDNAPAYCSRSFATLRCR
jgi:hypothetical protein